MDVHENVVCSILQFAAETEFDVLGLTFSPIKGPEGNIEYLICLEKSDAPDVCFDVEATVDKSHETLDKREKS